MRILIFTWRDIDHPRAGGAEVVIQEMGKRWVDWGHEVTLCTSRFSQSQREDEIDGVKIIRLGNPFTTYFRVCRYYKKHLKGKYDVVIEEIHGLMPWFSYYYVDIPQIALIHQNGRSFDEFNLKNSVAYYEFPPVVSLGVYMAEPHVLRYFKKLPLLVMSRSTRKDFIDLGHSSDNIHVIPEGIKVKPIESLGSKENNPTFICVGRLRRPKRVEHAIEAMKLVRYHYPGAKLWILGRGTPVYEEELKQLVKQLDLANNVVFQGFVSEKKKFDMLKRSHALIMPSIREGWGLVVTEANAMGTPAIGYDVAGLRDSIIDGKTGTLVESGNIHALGVAMVKHIRHPALAERLTLNAWKWSGEFTWDRTAKVCLARVKHILSEGS